MQSSPDSRPDPPVVIFDGVCNLCNSSVDFLIRHDRGAKLRFAANQGEAGRGILERHGESPDDVATLYLYEDGKLYDRSSAVLRACRHLAFPYRALAGLSIVPRSIRDFVYRWVAERRYRWFGKRDTCRIPTPAERERFL